MLILHIVNLGTIVVSFAWGARLARGNEKFGGARLKDNFRGGPFGMRRPKIEGGPIKRQFLGGARLACGNEKLGGGPIK